MCTKGKITFEMVIVQQLKIEYSCLWHQLKADMGHLYSNLDLNYKQPIYEDFFKIYLNDVKSIGSKWM